MRKLLPILLLTALAVLSACEKKVEMDPELYNSDQVGLMIKGKKVFTYTEGTMQLGYNRSLRQFRAGNDEMTSYFVVTCSELPTTVGQEIRAEVKWTSGSSVKTTSGITFKVEKYENTGLVWLWCAADNTGAVVKILNYRDMSLAPVTLGAAAVVKRQNLSAVIGHYRQLVRYDGSAAAAHDLYKDGGVVRVTERAEKHRFNTV